MKEEEQKIQDKTLFSPNKTGTLLQQIADLQVVKSHPHFPIGTLPSFRENKLLRYRRPDDNIFATASTIFILNEIKEKLSSDEQKIVERLTQNAQSAYPLYQNKDGLATYNFWQTQPSQHFSHGKILHKLKHFKLPDDIDDTALIYLTNPYSEEQNFWLKEKLTQHTQLKSAPKSYVYGTWFGENMPIEQDVCALCNLMYWIFENEFPLNKYDEATLEFLKDKILSGDFKKKPFQTARHYATVPLTLYHYARLIYKFDVKQIVDCKVIVVNEATDLLNKECSPMDRILLSTILLKLAPECETLNQLKLNDKLILDDKFYSFIGAFVAPYAESRKQSDSTFFQKVAAHPLTRFNWKCEAHELALQLENFILCSEFQSGS
jgi:hypothetical protein